MISQASTAATNIGKELFTEEGRAGNITVEEIGKLAKVGALGAQWYKGAKGSKAIKRQTVPAEITPANTIVTHGDTSYKLSGEVAENAAKKTLKFFPASKSSKIDAKEEYQDRLKKLIQEQHKVEIPKEAVLQTQINSAKSSGLKLAEQPSTEAGQGYIKARKEWELAKKKLGEDFGKVKGEGKTITKEVKPTIFEVKEQPAKVMYSKKKVGPKRVYKSKAKSDKSLDSAILQQGGILKLQTPKSYFLPNSGKFTGDKVKLELPNITTKLSTEPLGVSYNKKDWSKYFPERKSPDLSVPYPLDEGGLKVGFD